MKITPTTLKVLRAVEEHEGCGANFIQDVLWPDTRRHMALRAGQYMGRLYHKGLIRKRFDDCYVIGYYLTPLARDILNSER